MHLFFNCLETLEAGCWRRCDTGALYGGRLHHRRRIQVRGKDLERRARKNLLGPKDTGLDQLAEPVAGDAASVRRLRNVSQAPSFSADL